MDQIRVNKIFVAEVLDFDVPNKITRWKEFGGISETSESRILIDRYLSPEILASGSVDYSNGVSGIPIFARYVEPCDSGWYLYYDLDLSSETKPDAELGVDGNPSDAIT